MTAVYLAGVALAALLSENFILVNCLGIGTRTQAFDHPLEAGRTGAADGGDDPHRPGHLGGRPAAVPLCSGLLPAPGVCSGRPAGGVGSAQLPALLRARAVPPPG